MSEKEAPSVADVCWREHLKTCFSLSPAYTKQYREDPCKREARRQWLEAHPDYNKTYMQAYRERNKEALKAKRLAKYAADREAKAKKAEDHPPPFPPFGLSV